tara:strand:+ start:99 stop:506 length:408 start_codon:yes stop_codon:yes gene_type:complete
MTKIFIAYKVTGEDYSELKKRIYPIQNALKQAGIDYYSTIDDNEKFWAENWSRRKITEMAFGEMDSSDIILFLVNSSNISNGMLIELGYSLANNKKMVLAIRKDVTKNIFRQFIDNVIEFSSFDELSEKLKKFEF